MVPKIRDCFLRVFVSIFRPYQECIDQKKLNSANFEKYFDKKKFLELMRKDYKPFVEQFIQTQIFQRFLDKKANPQRNEDMLQTRYFDENIIAKSNRLLLSTPKALLSFFPPVDCFSGRISPIHSIANSIYK